MPWCPKCKTEYRDGFTACADCGSTLVKEIPETGHAGQDRGELAFLTGASDTMAPLIGAALEDAGIPYICKQRGAGVYLKTMMGMNFLGGDFYVPEKMLERAQEAVNIFAESPPEEDAYAKPVAGKREKRRIEITKRLAFLLIIPAIGVIIILVLSLLGK